MAEQVIDILNPGLVVFEISKAGGEKKYIDSIGHEIKYAFIVWSVAAWKVCPQQ